MKRRAPSPRIGNMENHDILPDISVISDKSNVYILGEDRTYHPDPIIYLEQDTLPCAVLPGLAISFRDVFAEPD